MAAVLSTSMYHPPASFVRYCSLIVSRLALISNCNWIKLHRKVVCRPTLVEVVLENVYTHGCIVFVWSIHPNQGHGFRGLCISSLPKSLAVFSSSSRSKSSYQWLGSLTSSVWYLYSILIPFLNGVQTLLLRLT